MDNKYYCITAHTPFVGEDNDYFYKGERNTPAFYQFADDCVTENAYEWMDDDNLETYYDGDECAYMENCYYDVKEITKEEYEECAYGS